MLTAAQTKSAFEDTKKNPTSTAKPTVVECTLVFDGVTFDPKAFYEMLDAKYGTVRSDKDAVARRNYKLRITT